MRRMEYEFVSTDSSAVISQLVEKYQEITGRTLQPADPDRLFLSWVADAIVKGLVRINYVGNQNIPSRADGENLDALGEWIYALKRKDAQTSSCTVRFHIVSPRESAILIPAGTRVTDKSQSMVWSTTEDAVIQIGDTYVDVIVKSDTAGTVGNGYVLGQIDMLVDVDNIMYFDHCENITVTDGGADRQDDETYFQMMRKVLDSYSTAGAEGSYIYWAKSVSDEIEDVKAVRPREHVTLIVPVCIDENGKKCVFIGGNYLNENSIAVNLHGAKSPASLTSDYFFSYENDLLKITIQDGSALYDQAQLDISFIRDLPGHVYIYALMKDGETASETIKDEIYKACNADYVRPLTDYVSVKNPEIVEYDIDFTYYISVDTQVPLKNIEAAINFQIGEYVKWQYKCLGRDINPSKLSAMLMQTGVKRLEIRSPTFTSLRSGDTFDVPQVAHVRNINVINGGYEDE